MRDMLKVHLSLLEAAELMRADRSLLLPPAEELAAFCQRWHIQELSLFGSALRDDFRPDSDLDFLATFGPDARWTLTDWVSMEDELATLVGRRVDLVSRRAVERSANAARRQAVLASAEPIYVAR